GGGAGREWGGGVLKEGAAAQGRRPVAAGGDRAGQEGGVLDPRRGVAPRRARAVRARDAVRGDVATAGLLRAPRRAGAARRSRRGPGGSEPPALGAARVHALARAPRRARAGRCPHAGAARRALMVLHVVGARPNYMKVAPVYAALEQRGVEQQLVHTGQHYDALLKDAFFAELPLPRPHVQLETRTPEKAAAELERAFAELAPDLVVVA